MTLPSQETISTDAFEKMGFFPSEGTVLTPATNQKDMFDNSTPFDGITADTLKKELENKANTPAAKTENTTTEEEDTNTDSEKLTKTPSLEQIADDISKAVNAVEPETPENEQEKKDRARGGTVTYLKNKIEKGGFVTWNDYDESKQSLDEYLGSMTETERQELIDKNYEIREDQIKTEHENEVIASLPGHLKYVAKAIADGIMDPETAYVALGRIEQNKRLDPNDANDQEFIIESYLNAQQFGTPAEIAEQIGEWKEAGVLDKKALQMKPKLDRMQEEQLAFYAQESEKFKQEQQKAAEWYAQSVQQALSDFDLGGVNITKKQAAKLYDDLLLNIKPSVRDGRPMNALWQTLERIQVVEPDFKHLAKITWLATDPKGYDEALIQKGRNEATGKITKELKTTQGSGNDRGQELAPEQTKRTSNRIIKQRNPFDAITRR